MPVNEVDLDSGFSLALVTVVNDELAVTLHGALVRAKELVIKVCLLCFWALSVPDVSVPRRKRILSCLLLQCGWFGES